MNHGQTEFFFLKSDLVFTLSGLMFLTAASPPAPAPGLMPGVLRRMLLLPTALFRSTSGDEAAAAAAGGAAGSR